MMGISNWVTLDANSSELEYNSYAAYAGQEETRDQLVYANRLIITCGSKCWTINPLGMSIFAKLLCAAPRLTNLQGP